MGKTFAGARQEAPVQPAFRNASEAPDPVERENVRSGRRLVCGCIFLAAVGIQATAQAPSRLAASIRNLDREDPATLAALPRLLSQAGLYRNIGDKALRAIADTSVVAFSVNSALWSDGSHKERFISLPAGAKVVPTDTGKYAFPDNAVLIKNFLIDTIHGDNSGNSRIHIETRFLVYQAAADRRIWSGISYRWIRDQSDAVLVHPDSGLDFTHSVRLNGRPVGKRWRYPSTFDCAQCHKGDEGTHRGSLGFITPQLNRIPQGSTVNQLQALFTRGILSANPVSGRPNAHRWHGLAETSASLEQRARSYLASNCSHCHGNNVLHGQAKQNFDYFGANSRIVYRPDPDGLDDPAGAYVGMPSLGSSELPQLIMPGYPDSSFIIGKMKYRLDAYPSSAVIDQMPPLATAQPDSAAVALMEQWACALRTGTPCRKTPWLPDETFWDSAASPAAALPHSRQQAAAFRPRILRGILSIPDRSPGIRVELSDLRGRRIRLVSAGPGMFRVPEPLPPGVYLLLAGPQRNYLNYVP